MNDAQRRLAMKALSINSSRKNNSQDLNSSLYDKRTYNEMREGLVDYSADKLKSALSAYITDPIYITNVVNDKGNITINYRLLDENLNEELVEFELSDGLDYIENIHLYASRQGDCSGRRPMIHRQKPLNCSTMTADDAKKKYKELLTQCYIAVYDHKLDVNDAQVVEYRKQMKKLTDEFGDISATMDNYIANLDKKYKNKVNFVELSLDSGLFSKKQKPSDEILKMYKQLKKSIDSLIKSGTPASNSNLKNMQAKAAEFEKQYDAKSLKMALAASRRRINSSRTVAYVDEEYIDVNLVSPDGTILVSGSVDSNYDFCYRVTYIDDTNKLTEQKYCDKVSQNAYRQALSYRNEDDTALLNEISNILLNTLGTDDFIECDDEIEMRNYYKALRAEADNLKQQAYAEQDARHAREWEAEYGYPREEFIPHMIDELLSQANSSRRINSSRRNRRRLNSAVTRYAGDDEFQTYYFIAYDNSLVASFDVFNDNGEISYEGFMRGYSDNNYVVDERSITGALTDGADVLNILMDLIYDETGVMTRTTDDTYEFTKVLRDINRDFRKANNR